MLQRVFLLLLITAITACSIPGSTPDAAYEHAPGGALAAAISVDSGLVVVSSVENGIAVWDIQTQEQRYQWRHQGEGNNLVASTRIAFDNSYVVTSDREAFALWSLSTGEPEGFWRIDESSIRDIAVADQGRGILVGRGNGQVMFFEPQSGRRLEFLGHQEKINSIDLSPNGFYALTGGNDFMAYLWDTRTGQVVYSFSHPSRVTKVALDFQGRYAFTADSKNNARIWDLRTGQQVSKLHYLQRQKIFSAAKFSEDGKYLLTGSPSRGLSLWDVKSGDEVSSWMVTPRRGSQPQSAVVYDVAFMPGRQVMSHSSSGLTEVWSY